ncbi:hypothetical protein BpHYR1_027228 [Brachionus plicatilis]|uniref:Uncharacterized protein n=1 Tax=Brachionus plicatilis TaxID=10195 RepID=A0A3M7T821_BRAPC|nr:hypothetical protein BpHYR1_027228 [Brachionus plicatilis]
MSGQIYGNLVIRGYGTRGEESNYMCDIFLKKFVLDAISDYAINKDGLKEKVKNCAESLGKSDRFNNGLNIFYCLIIEREN